VKDWERFPAIVKPAFEHCSLGIDTNAVVLDAKELGDRVAYIRETYAQPALVEEFIDGREFHVTLWGNGHIHMLPPAEMDFSAFTDVRDRLCTFDSHKLRRLNRNRCTAIRSTSRHPHMLCPTHTYFLSLKPH
jgi:D-alanine-D-alanine ligase